MNVRKPTITEHLAFLSVKHGVYLAELFQALLSAREDGKSTCMDLTVQYRGSIKHQAIFLITKQTKVIVQFRVDEEFLHRKDLHFETWMNTDKIRRQIFKQTIQPHVSTMIQDLRHGMKKVNVEAEVLETPKPSIVYTRYGNTATVINAWIADETGKVKLCLWNQKANSFAEGDAIQVKNAQVSTFRGERQLCLGRTGEITILRSHGTGTKQEPKAIVKNVIYA